MKKASKIISIIIFSLTLIIMFPISLDKINLDQYLDSQATAPVTSADPNETYDINNDSEMGDVDWEIGEIPTPSPTPVLTPGPSDAPTPEPTVDYKEIPGQFVSADMSWFDDALFIGDSRTDGLRRYSGIKNADFFCATGVGVKKIMTMSVVVPSFDRNNATTLQNLLKNKTYGKIYISLGINEIGGNMNTIVGRYETLLNSVRALAPDSIIYVMANLHVTKARSDRNSYGVTNQNLNTYNQRTSQLADGKMTYYIDPNVVFDDENGNLKSPDYSSASGDGAHIYAKCYVMWKDWLLTVAIDKALNKPVISPTQSPSSTVGTTPSATPEVTPSITPQITPSPTPAPTPTPSPTQTPKPTPSPTAKPTATATPIPTEKPSVEPESTESIGSDVTVSPSPSATVSLSDPNVEGRFIDVDMSWFDDALFIGDSRTDGLRVKSGIKTADFFCATSSNSSNILTKTVSIPSFNKGTATTLENLLKNKTYGKIYISIGINEVGNNMNTIVKRYKNLLDTVRGLQPNAIIYIMANQQVSKVRSDKNIYGVTIENIATHNQRTSEFADGKMVYYIDPNEVFTDETGALFADYSSDGVHLYSKYYKTWCEYMLTKGIAKP